MDIISLLQQVEGQDQQLVEDLKREVVQFVSERRNLAIPENSTLSNDYRVKDNISIEEMYDLTDGKVEYGQANSIVKNLFYLARSQSKARELAKLLNQIIGDNPQYC